MTMDVRQYDAVERFASTELGVIQTYVAEALQRILYHMTLDNHATGVVFGFTTSIAGSNSAGAPAVSITSGAAYWPTKNASWPAGVIPAGFKDTTSTLALTAQGQNSRTAEIVVRPKEEITEQVTTTKYNADTGVIYPNPNPFYRRKNARVEFSSYDKTGGVTSTIPVNQGWIKIAEAVVSATNGVESISLTAHPRITPLLTKHHTGAPGAAPKIDLTSEVQNRLPIPNITMGDQSGLDADLLNLHPARDTTRNPFNPATTVYIPVADGKNNNGTPKNPNLDADTLDSYQLRTGAGDTASTDYVPIADGTGQAGSSKNPRFDADTLDSYDARTKPGLNTANSSYVPIADGVSGTAGTSKNPRLDADTLDGKHASEIASGNVNNGTGLTKTVDVNGVVTLAADWGSGTNNIPRGDHNHDDRYYTETEMNGLLSGKANTAHPHYKLDASGARELALQDDGNLVRYTNGVAKWNITEDGDSTNLKATPYSHTHSGGDVTSQVVSAVTADQSYKIRDHKNQEWERVSLFVTGGGNGTVNSGLTTIEGVVATADSSNGGCNLVCRNLTGGTFYVEESTASSNQMFAAWGD